VDELNYFRVPFFCLSLILTACNVTPQVGGNTAIRDDPALPLVTPPGSRNTSNTSIPAPGDETEKPLALIYKGIGSCSLDQGDAGTTGYGCSEASADSATLAGFRYQFVGPNALSSKSSAADVAALFGQAKVWIQPGGVSNDAYNAMSSRLKSELKNFINGGGGYVGFCAGAFLATDWFYLLPATSDFYNYSAIRGLTYAFLPITWDGAKHAIYFEGGPYFYGIGKDVEVTAKFSGGEAAAIRGAYGKGRVYVSGPHPEAPAVWSEEDGKKDPDGQDHALAAEMIHWAAQL
jgi:hypothetical protein